MKILIRKPKFNEILAIFTTILLIIGTIIFTPPWYDIVPLFVSIVVMFLSSNVNRYTFLLGGLNSILYTVAYLYMTLYSQAAQALLISFPFQIASFIAWSKNTNDGQTAIKRFSTKGRILLFATMMSAWVVLYIIFSLLNSSYLILDNTVTVIATASTVLALLRYSEYAILSLIGSVINLVLFVQVTIDTPDKCIWLVYSAYSAICVLIAFIKMNKRSSNK